MHAALCQPVPEPRQIGRESGLGAAVDVVSTPARVHAATELMPTSVPRPARLHRGGGARPSGLPGLSKLERRHQGGARHVGGVSRPGLPIKPIAQGGGGEKNKTANMGQVGQAGDEGGMACRTSSASTACRLTATPNARFQIGLVGLQPGGGGGSRAASWNRAAPRREATGHGARHVGRGAEDQDRALHPARSQAQPFGLHRHEPARRPGLAPAWREKAGTGGRRRPRTPGAAGGHPWRG